MPAVCEKKIPVGVLGATGIVGQQLLSLLQEHPWFEVVFLAASDASAGKSYAEAVQGRWQGGLPIGGRIGELPLHRLSERERAECSLIFSALSSEVAQEHDLRYAEKGCGVISHAACHRKSPHIPMIIPEVNAAHLSILKKGKGFIVSKPNCSIQSVVLPLSPLHRAFGVKKIAVTTLQAISGAGLPGIPSLHITDNVIPHIPGEEEKSEWEPLKIWGQVESGAIVPAQDIQISAQCNRVPVLDGHLACLSVAFEKKPTLQEILSSWEAFEGLSLPSAPQRPLLYLHDNDRPQPRLDRLQGKGMVVTVGRLRPCPLFDYRFTALSHNTIRGAGGGSILTAELLVNQNYL